MAYQPDWQAIQQASMRGDMSPLEFAQASEQVDPSGKLVWGKAGPGSGYRSGATNLPAFGDKYRIGMDPSSWLKSAQFSNKVSPYDKNSDIFSYDPEQGWLVKQSAANPIIEDLQRQQSEKNSQGFWNGIGPWALGLGAFAAPLAAGAFGAGAGEGATAGLDTVGAYPQSWNMLAGEAPSGGMTIGDYSLAGMGGSGGMGLTPTTVGGLPLDWTTMGAGGLSSGAATLGTGGAMEDFLSRIFTPMFPGGPSVGSTLVNTAGNMFVTGLAGRGGSASPGADAATGLQSQISADQWNYYKQNYQPLETKLIANAMAAGSPEEYAQAAGAANADVTGAFDQAGKQAASRLQSFGINPASPAYQSGMQSMDLAKGAASAGAQTQARNYVKNLAYSKMLDVTGLGRGIPAQSAASSASAANAALNASRLNFAQNQARMQNAGYLAGPAIRTLGSVAQNWFGTPAYSPATSYDSSGLFTPPYTGYDVAGGPAYGAKGGRVTPRGFQRGGIDMTHTGTHIIAPHMQRYAVGGGVGRQGMGLDMMDQSNMGATIDNETGQVVGPGDGTSDSVPAQIDGEQPAALSSGEFVMNAAVPEMTGAELLTAINDAGLKKRQQSGLEPQQSADVSQNAGAQAYAKGGRVREGIAPRRRMDTTLLEQHQQLMDDSGNPVGARIEDLRMMMPNVYRGRFDEREPTLPPPPRFQRSGLDYQGA